MPDKTASYGLRFDSNAKEAGNEGAAALDKLRSSVGTSLASIKDMNSSLRLLRGSTDEVKKAKDELRGKLEAEKAAVSAANLQLLKAGTSYESLAAQTKKATEEQKKHEQVVKSVAAPVEDLRGKFEKFKATVTTAAGAEALLVLAAVALAAAMVELTRKVVETGIALGRWIVGAADAARSAGLLREAWTGSAENAAHLGNQIDALARKVPTARDKLLEMSGTLVKALNNSRVSGQGIIDTFNAVAQASSAMGDEAGNALREIIERGKNIGRIGIGQFELQGRVKRDDIAKQLAEDMHIGVDQARLALAQGYVQIDAGAKAIREVVEKRFGDINARKLLTLDVQLQRFHERLDKLASAVNIEPLLKGLDELANLFDATTVTGAALKDIVTALGNAIATDIGGSTGSVKDFFGVMVLGALKATIAFLQFRNWVKQHSEVIKVSLVAIGSALAGIAAIAVLVGAAIAAPFILVAASFAAVGVAIYALYRGVKALWGLFTSISWRKIGTSIIDGLVNGLKAGWEGVKKTVGGIADGIADTFAGVLQIRSPSRVFQEFGRQTTRGYEKGLEEGTPGTQRVVDRMAPDAPAGADAPKAVAADGGGRAAPIQLVVNIDASGSHDAGKQLAQPQFLASLTKAVQDALVGAGLPVQTEPA